MYKMMRRLAGDLLRHAFTGRHWFRCALAALALRYAFDSALAGNEPYWEPDVAYLHWSTDVPTVTVCPAAAKSTPDHSEIDNTLSENIIKWTEEFKKKDGSTLCASMFKNCSWNGKVFNCCRHFQPHLFVTENPCFSINSQQTVNRRKKLVVSHFSKKGELKMEFTDPVKISLHGHAEVRFSGKRDRRMPDIAEVVVENGLTTDVLYATRQTVEGSSLAGLSFSARGCVLRGEKRLHRHPVYGQTACLLECALLEPGVYAKNHSACDCPPTCATIEIKTVWNGTQRSLDKVTRCVLTMSKPATERLVMKAKKDYVELTVIFACLLQLFTGFNLLEVPKFISSRNKGPSVQR